MVGGFVKFLDLTINHFIKITRDGFKTYQINQKGMTLVEIMIVLIIIGGLMSVLAPNVIRQLTRGNISTARIQIKEIGKQLDMFRADCGSYPTAEQGLEALMEAPGDCSTWGPEPYIDKIPKDPWKSDFVYEVDGSSYTLTSLGADKREGGTGADADISSADL